MLPLEGLSQQYVLNFCHCTPSAFDLCNCFASCTNVTLPCIKSHQTCVPLYIPNPCYVQSTPTCENIVANDDSTSTPKGKPVIVPVLANDVQVVPSMGLSVTRLPYDGRNGQCVIIGDGIGLMYVPESDFQGADTCVYETCDEEQRCGTATLTILVVPSEDEPVAYDDTITTLKNTPVPISPLDNDIEVPGYELAVKTITKDGSTGTCVVDSGTVVMYVPNSDYVGQDTCVYQACDVRDKCDTATITIMVEGEKEPCDGGDVVEMKTQPVRRNFEHSPLMNYSFNLNDPNPRFSRTPSTLHNLTIISHQPVTSELIPNPITPSPLKWTTPIVRSCLTEKRRILPSLS